MKEERFVSDVLADLDCVGFGPLVEEVAAKHKVTREDVVGRSRLPNCLRARRDFIARLYVMEMRSITEISRMISNDTHSIHDHLIKAGVQIRARGSGR